MRCLASFLCLLFSIYFCTIFFPCSRPSYGILNIYAREVTVNASGRQAASFVRVASALGWPVRAQMKDRIGIVAQDICARPGVTVIEGSLADPKVLEELFRGSPEVAFINTTHWGDEVAIGCAIADAAVRAGVRHLVYSSMPDHGAWRGWTGLPLWTGKAAVERYIRGLGIPTTFIYCGVYHNNFTSLPYPLFRMEMQEGGGFVWQAPFHPDRKLPWVDAEQDVGPVVLQIFKEGVGRWGGRRVPLAFEYLTPREVCRAFSRALERPVEYVRGPVEVAISIPRGYQQHLSILESVLGWGEAPYFGPDLEPNCTQLAQHLWQGSRGIEEYAREVFPVEEYNNGLRWMEEDESDQKTNTVYEMGC
ncbi:NAD(P)-binding protein [Trichodelitschia bisporula]|uniref:NAD(P)-binding protein n=1 Tax=Trichodelitschia bisporula TaxID=703511 RepID=A0A6G1I4D2_9PEZI|nr:NAD(P)-binding protein [Trichodelitschia bisporula]